MQKTVPTIAVENVFEYLLSLPDELKEFLMSEATTDAVISLKNSFGIAHEDAVKLSKRISLFTAGLISSPEFKNWLQTIAPQGKLKEFQHELVSKVFSPYANELKKHAIPFEKIESEEIAAPRPPTAPTAISPEIKPSPPPPVTVSQPAPAPIIPPQVQIPPRPEGTRLAPTSVGAAPPPPKPKPEMPMPRPEWAAPTPQSPKAVVTPPYTATAPTLEPKKEEPSVFQPVRYTTPTPIPEVPKVITPSDGSRPSEPSHEPKKPEEKIPEGIIDLSTFQLTKKAPGTNPPQPKAMGNTLDLGR